MLATSRKCPSGVTEVLLRLGTMSRRLGGITISPMTLVVCASKIVTTSVRVTMPSARVVRIDHVHLAMIGGDFEITLVAAKDGAEQLSCFAVDDPDFLQHVHGKLEIHYVDPIRLGVGQRKRSHLIGGKLCTR